jgi:predicted DNA-binding transcriptional regulator YafY
MKHAAHQLSETTTADMYRAMDRQHPVTLTYIKADGTETIRTIEIYDVRTTKAGRVTLKAMDRQSGESRTFRIDRIVSYTTHRSTYVVARPADETAPTFRTEATLTDYEIGRDDATYWAAKYDREPEPDYDHAA